MEHKYSIKYEYMINNGLFKRFMKDKKHIVVLLKAIYTQIVRPMTDDVVELMGDNNLVNEAELFCSDLQFRRHKTAKNGMMIGDESKKDEDILLYVSQRLKEITKKYNSKLN